MEQESCDAFLRAARAFEWATKPELVIELGREVANLGNCYSMLIDGKRLIGSE